MALVILRVVLVLVAAGVGVRLVQSSHLPNDPPWIPWAAVGGLVLLALVVIAIDIAVRRKRIETVSAVYFGLIVGLFLTYVLRLALAPVLPENAAFAPSVQIVLGMLLTYSCISLLIQTK